jgi:hypothetical protein
MTKYEQLKIQIIDLQKANKLPTEPSREERISWAYGNAVIENAEVTRVMAEKAVDQIAGK